MNKREFLIGTGGLLAAGAALKTRQSKAAEVDACGRVANPATFVLVPGAWSGGFVYNDVAAILRRRGHRVFAVTLTGMGERSHLLSRDINLTTHITDIVNVIRFNELENVVLAGHSYGGMPVTGAADAVADRISSLIYLDAFVPADGQTMLDLAGGGASPGAGAPAGAEPPVSFPMPPQMADLLGIPEEERWKYTETPTGPGSEPLQLTGAIDGIARKTFVRATKFPQFKATYDALKADPTWRTETIDTGHSLMLEDPERTAEILENAAPNRS